MDEKIVGLILSGQDEGLKLLQQRYFGLMHYIVQNILHDTGDTEECISDICMKVWHSIESYSSEKSKFSTWLTVIARNTALNYLNRNQRSCEELKEDTAKTSSPEEEVFRREQIESLKEAISTLSSQEQHLFYRKYYYLQQTAQIAAELGMTQRSVEGKLYRLRKKLKEKLGGDFT